MKKVSIDVTDHIKNKKEFVRLVARRANFTNTDVEIILEEIIKVFEEATLIKKEIKVRGFGKLYHQVLPERINGLTGQTISKSYRTAFRLSENIRAGGMFISDDDGDDEIEEEDDA